MEVEFELTFEDLIEWGLYHAEHSPALRQARAGVAALGIGAFGGAAILLSYLFPANTVTFVPVGIVAGTLWAALVPRYSRRWLRALLAPVYAEGENRLLTGSHFLRLAPEALMGRTDFARTEIDWALVERIEETPTHVFIYISATQALIIPKRAFRPPDGVRAFVAQTREFRATSAGQAADAR